MNEATEQENVKKLYSSITDTLDAIDEIGEKDAQSATRNMQKAEDKIRSVKDDINQENLTEGKLDKQTMKQMRGYDDDEARTLYQSVNDTLEAVDGVIESDDKKVVKNLKNAKQRIDSVSDRAKKRLNKRGEQPTEQDSTDEQIQEK